MRISPVNNTGYKSSIMPRSTNHDPNFGALLHVAHNVEDLIRIQSYTAAKGDVEKYQNLMYGFGKTMEHLMEKIKPLPGEVTVIINPHLQEFMNEAVETRGTYYGPQLALIPGLPRPGKITYYEFTYKPNDNSLVDKLYKASKDLLKMWK